MITSFTPPYPSASVQLCNKSICSSASLRRAASEDAYLGVEPPYTDLRHTTPSKPLLRVIRYCLLDVKM